MKANVEGEIYKEIPKIERIIERKGRYGCKMVVYGHLHTF